MSAERLRRPRLPVLRGIALVAFAFCAQVGWTRLGLASEWLWPVLLALAGCIAIVLHAAAGAVMAALRGEPRTLLRELAVVALALGALMAATDAGPHAFGRVLIELSPAGAHTPHGRYCAWMGLLMLAAIGFGLQVAAGVAVAAWGRRWIDAARATALGLALLAVAAFACNEASSPDFDVFCEGPCDG